MHARHAMPESFQNIFKEGDTDPMILGLTNHPADERDY